MKTLLLEDFTVLRKEEGIDLVAEMSTFGRGFFPGEEIEVQGRDRRVTFTRRKVHRDREGDVTVVEFVPTDKEVGCTIHLFND